MNAPSLALLAVGALVVTGVAMRPRAEVRSPRLALLRVLLPSWRFFDAIASMPRVLVRSGPAPDSLGEWRQLLAPPQRSWANLVWHPAGNLSLAQHSLLERLLTDIAELADGAEPADTVSYQLARNLVRAGLRDAGVAPGTAYQWKVADTDAMTGDVTDDLLLSPAEVL